MRSTVRAAALTDSTTVPHPTPVPQANVAYWRASRRCAAKGTSPRMVQSEPARPDESPRPPLLRVERVTKSFPGVLALQDVSLEVHPGEVLGLVGENGAGKSTLMKILSGVYQPDSGEIILDGKPVVLHSPRQAQDLGISIIYQEFNLMPNLSVEENVFVG